MKRFLIIALLIAATNTSLASEELKVGVKGMVCAFCAQGIEKKFLANSEVKKVEVSLENKFVKLTFNDGRRLADDKVTEILKDAGYEAVFEPKAPLDAKTESEEKKENRKEK